MKVHELKILPKFFDAVLDGRKTFEIRKNDRGYEEGDILLLKEYYVSDLPFEVEGDFTGRAVFCLVTYILPPCALGGHGLADEYVAFSIERLLSVSTIEEESSAKKAFEFSEIMREVLGV